MLTSTKIARQLRGLETRHVHNLAKRAMDMGNREVYVPLLPRRHGDWTFWSEIETIAPNEIAGYVYPADMVAAITEQWLNDFIWTIGKRSPLNAVRSAK